MDGSSVYAITSLYSQLDIFLLIFVRLLGFFMLLPIIAGSNVPNQVKVILAILTAFIIFTTNRVTEISYNDSVFGYGLLLIQEFVVGLTLGFVAYAFFTIIYFAGQMIDYQIGFSMLSVLDPATQIQVPITGNLLYYVMAMFLILTGGLHRLIYAICTSYDAIPIGAAVLVGNESIYVTILAVIAQYFVLGVQIAMPIAGSIVVLDIALGILVKAAPQMNVFTVGLPIKVLIGLLILWFITPVFGDVFGFIFDGMMGSMTDLMRGMVP